MDAFLDDPRNNASWFQIQGDSIYQEERLKVSHGLNVFICPAYTSEGSVASSET